MHCAQVVGSCHDLSPLPSPRPGRDINPTSRPPFCPTKTAQVVTSKMGSRHQFPYGRQNHVATSNRCRDTTQANPGRDTKTRSRPSWRLLYVATSILCCDLVSAHSGLSRSRHQNPGRDQPLFPSQNALVATQNLGRDIKPPQSIQNHVATSIRCRDTTASVSSCDAKTGHPHNQVATSISGRDLTSSQTSCDLITMSRPQEVLTHNKLFFFSFFFQNPPVAFPATPKDAVA